MTCRATQHIGLAAGRPSRHCSASRPPPPCCRKQSQQGIQGVEASHGPCLGSSLPVSQQCMPGRSTEPGPNKQWQTAKHCCTLTGLPLRMTPPNQIREATLGFSGSLMSTCTRSPLSLQQGMRLLRPAAQQMDCKAACRASCHVEAMDSTQSATHRVFACGEECSKQTADACLTRQETLQAAAD